MGAWQARSAVLTLALLLAAGCGDGAPEQASPPSTDASESGTPTAEPDPELLSSTTREASKPPKGAAIVEMKGPPPVILPSTLTADRGARTAFFIDNNSPAGDSHGSHALAIGTDVGAPVAVSDLVPAGTAATFIVRGLEPGHYQVWCDYTNHAYLGQVGTLEVR